MNRKKKKRNNNKEPKGIDAVKSRGKQISRRTPYLT